MHGTCGTLGGLRVSRGGVMDMRSEPDAPVSREDGDGCKEDGLEV